MDPRNEEALRGRVIAAASRVVATKGWVGAVDLLVGIGWLTDDRVAAWRRGEVPYLERVVIAGLGKITTAMRHFHQWCSTQGLQARRTEYVTHGGRSRRPLQFSKSGNHDIEERYRAHWVTPACATSLDEQPKKTRAAKSREDVATEPLVFIPRRDSQCDACRRELGRGAFIRVLSGKSQCMTCAGYDDLVYVPSGNAALTRVRGPTAKSTPSS